MRTLYPVFGFLFLFISLSGDAQTGDVDLRFSSFSIDCANQILLVDIEVKANEGEAFFLHNQNYRFSFDETVLANPTINQELAPSGLIDFGAGGISLFSPHNLNGSLGEVVSYNIVVSGGDGYPLDDSTWIGVGRLQFDILDLDACIDLNWHRSDVGPFPATTLLGSASGALFLLGEDETLNLNQCIVSDCGAFEIRLNPVETDCENSKLFVDLEIRAPFDFAGFNLSNQNYRFTFDDQVIDNPVIDQELTISAQVQEAGTNSFYNPHTLTGSVANIVSYNVTLAFGEGYPVGMDWVGVGRLEFDILDPNACSFFDWNTSDPDDFPNTLIVGLDANQMAYEVQSENYFNNDVCFPECQTTSITNTSLDQIRIFPSVTSGPVSIEFKGDQVNKEWEIIILTTSGKILESKKRNISGSNHLEQINLSNYPSGSYQIFLRSANNSKVFTVIRSE